MVSFGLKWNSHYDGNGLAGQFWQMESVLSVYKSKIMLYQFAASYTGDVKKWEICAQFRVFQRVQSSVFFLSPFLSSDELFMLLC